MQKNWLKTTTIAVGSASVLALLSTGCQSIRSQTPTWPIVQRIKNTPPTPVNDAPLVVDGAFVTNDGCYAQRTPDEN